MYLILMWVIRPPLTPPTQEGKGITWLNGYECGEFDAVKEITSVQAFVSDFDDEVHEDLLGVEVLYEFIGCFGCATSCQQVVMDQYYIVWFDGINVHLDSIYTVFLRE